jgi:hypothetical protein
MVVLLSDAEIQMLVTVEKSLPADYERLISTRPKKGHSERELNITGNDGSEFRLIFREARRDVFAFSVILAYRVPGTNQLFRLRRYNGKNHEHTNSVERQTFRDFHIHMATELYQRSGFKEDTYAEPSRRFSTFGEAVDCMIEDCGFRITQKGQKPLF